MTKLSDTRTLSNGCGIPCVGFGTFLIPNGAPTAAAVKAAVDAGYRLIDTGFIYENEAAVGEGIRAALAEGNMAREDLFVTGKVWNTERGYDTTIAAFERTAAALGLEYLDLYLIHWPAIARHYENWREINADTWRALTDLYQAGRVRAIGVSNFLPKHIEPLMETETAPMVDQIQYHPGMMQTPVVDWCREHGIAVEGWSPLGMGRLLGDPVLAGIAEKHGKTPAQVCIRWCLQTDVVPLPKSQTPERIVSNAQVFDFELDAEDMARIAAMDDGGFFDTDNTDWNK
ncbi:MAG: aldo/keto reductase [Lachnospiraceae bacterium]|nr:aldo/keto reductase [Lachnospiraceae bacterium]